MTRLFSGSVNGYKTQSQELDPISLAIVFADLFAANLDCSVQIGRMLWIIFADRLAAWRRVFAENLAIDRFRAGENDALDISGARSFQNIDRPIDTHSNGQAGIGFGRFRHERCEVRDMRHFVVIQYLL